MKRENKSIDNFMRKLLTEKVKGKNLNIKIFTNFIGDQLIIQLVANKHLLEKTYPNTKRGELMSQQFISKFKNGKDLERYFKGEIK